MDPIRQTRTVTSGPSARSPESAPDAPAPKMAADQAAIGARQRGVRVEVITNYLFFKRKQEFSLMPTADGKLVFSQSDGNGKAVSRQVVGQNGTPTHVALDVAVRAPFVSRRLHLDLSHDQDGSHIKVTDLKSGHVLAEADSGA